MEFKEGDRVRIIGGKHKKKANFGIVKRAKKKFVDVNLQVYVKSKEKGDAYDEIKEVLESVGIGNLELMPEIVATMPTMDDLKVVSELPQEDPVEEDPVEEEVVDEVEKIVEDVEDQVMFEKVGKDDPNLPPEVEVGSSDEEEAITFQDLAKQEKAQRKVIAELQQYEAEVIARRQQCQELEEQLSYYKDIALGHENHINSLKAELDKKEPLQNGVNKDDILKIIKLLTSLC